MLIDDIISYIKKCVKADTDIDSDIPIFEAYKYAHNIDPPEIQVQIINDTEHAGSYTFEVEQASRISVQITAYTRQMKLGGTMISAQRASRILGDKIKHWCAIEKINAEISDILLSSRASLSPAIPTDLGVEIYQTAVRFEFTTKYI